jgi:hypothetical protein
MSQACTPRFLLPEDTDDGRRLFHSETKMGYDVVGLPADMKRSLAQMFQS